jgi:hypothetical protein
MERPAWITNDPAAAKALRAADRAYDKARAAASGLPLAEKLEAYRAARAARQRAYNDLICVAPDMTATKFLKG